MVMDETVRSSEAGSFLLSGGGFMGQFCSVKQFLGHLVGSYKPDKRERER